MQGLVGIKGRRSLLLLFGFVDRYAWLVFGILYTPFLHDFGI